MSLEDIVECCGDSPVRLLEYMNMARNIQCNWKEVRDTVTEHAKEQEKPNLWGKTVDRALYEIQAALEKNRDAEKETFSRNGYWDPFLEAYYKEHYRLYGKGEYPASPCKAFLEFCLVVEKIAEEHTREFIERVQVHIRLAEQELKPEDQTVLPPIREVVNTSDAFKACWLLLDQYTQGAGKLDVYDNVDVYHNVVSSITEDFVASALSRFRNEPEKALAYLREVNTERDWPTYEREVYEPQKTMVGSDKELETVIGSLAVLKRYIVKDSAIFKLLHKFDLEDFESGMKKSDYVTFTTTVSQIAKEHLEETIRGLEERIAAEAAAKDEAQQSPSQDVEISIAPEEGHAGKVKRERQEKDGCCRVM